MLGRVEGGEQLPASDKAAWVKLLQVNTYKGGEGMLGLIIHPHIIARVRVPSQRLTAGAVLAGRGGREGQPGPRHAHNDQAGAQARRGGQQVRQGEGLPRRLMRGGQE